MGLQTKCLIKIQENMLQTKAQQLFRHLLHFFGLYTYYVSRERILYLQQLFRARPLKKKLKTRLAKNMRPDYKNNLEEAVFPSVT